MTTALHCPTLRNDWTRPRRIPKPCLAKLLSDALLPDEIARPKRLMDAMRYSSLGGGKRLRPFLVVESSAVFGVPREAALLAGAALECIHCYSLIHDDLPAMDNSDLRRGRPTLHKKTDDATAILAGDGLLTLAFDIITRDEIHRDANRAPAADARAGARVRHRRHGRRPDARPRRRRPLRRPRAGRRRAPAADEDRRAVALSAASPARSSASPRKRNIRRSTITAARSAKPSRSPTICSTSKAMRRRSASRPGRTPRSARPPSSPSSASTAPSSACATCWRAPIPRCRSSAPRATCCAPPRVSSPNARTERGRWRARTPTMQSLLRFRKMPKPVRVVYARPRTFIAIAIGIVAFFLLPAFAAAGDAAV